MEQSSTFTMPHRLIHGILQTAQNMPVQTGIWLLTFFDSVMCCCSYNFYMFIGALQIYILYDIIWYDIWYTVFGNLSVSHIACNILNNHIVTCRRYITWFYIPTISRQNAFQMLLDWCQILCSIWSTVSLLSLLASRVSSVFQIW